MYYCLDHHYTEQITGCLVSLLGQHTYHRHCLALLNIFSSVLNEYGSILFHRQSFVLMAPTSSHAPHFSCLVNRTYLCDQWLQQGRRAFAHTANGEAEASAAALHDPVISPVLI